MLRRGPSAWHGFHALFARPNSARGAAAVPEGPRSPGREGGRVQGVSRTQTAQDDAGEAGQSAPEEEAQNGTARQRQVFVCFFFFLVIVATDPDWGCGLALNPNSFIRMLICLDRMDGK